MYGALSNLIHHDLAEDHEEVECVRMEGASHGGLSVALPQEEPKDDVEKETVSPAHLRGVVRG